MAIDTDKIAEGVNPSGLDPEIEKKAEEYAKRDWQMSIKPVLDKVFPAGTNDELPMSTIAEIQNALFEHKYEVLENAANRADEAKANKLRWA